MTSKLDAMRKRRMKTILLIFFGMAVMLLLLQVSDIKSLIQSATQQVWIYLVMLFMKFGDETLWKPIEDEVKDELSESDKK
jgi:uncharacterized membrane protein YbhN (UPF0104 family)